VVWYYVFDSPLTAESEMIKPFPLLVLTQKLIIPLTQILTLFGLWRMGPNRRIVLLLGVMVMVNLGFGMRLSGRIFTLARVLQINDEPLQRTIFFNYGTTLVTENLTAFFGAYMVAPANAKWKWASWKAATCSFVPRMIYSFYFILFSVTRIAMPSTASLTFEMLLATLCMHNTLAMFVKRRPSHAIPSVALALEGETLRYIPKGSTAVSEISLSRELSTELKKVMKELAGKGSSDSLGQQEIKESLLPLADFNDSKDIAASMV